MTIQIPLPGRYRITPDRSAIHFAVKHRFGTGTVCGRFDVTAGELLVVEPPEQSTATVTADSTSFQSGNTSRDAKVKSDVFLDTQQFPEITFTSRSITPTDNGSWQLEGILNAHGVEVRTTFTLTDARSSTDGLDIAAVGTVDRYAHGVQAMKGMAGRRLDLTITLHADRTETP